jgi:predicted transposase YdaD
MAKSGLLSERERLPTLSLIFILRRRGYREQHGNFRLQVGSRPTQQVWFREVCFWKVKPRASWLAHPGLMSLYPLFDHGRSRRDVICAAADAISTHSTDPTVRADLLTTLAIFGKLVYPGLNVLELIGRERMKESKFYEEVLEEGREEGREEGMVLAILRILSERFSTEDVNEIRTTLESVDDPERLSELVASAVQCRSLGHFRRDLAALAREPRRP